MPPRQKWLDHSPELCETTSKMPSSLFKLTQHSEDDYSITSIHPVCISCYSLYVQVCKEVAEVFDLTLDKNKQEWTVEDLYYRIKEVIDHSIEEGSVWKKSNITMYLKDAEKKLQTIAKCLRARIYHHKNCTKRNPEKTINKRTVRLGNLFGDLRHDTFIIQLCFYISRLYEYYELLIQHYNFMFKTERNTYVNQLEKEVQDIIHQCERKFSTIKVDDTTVLDKHYLLEQRDLYITEKTMEKKPTAKSRTLSKPSYTPTKQIRTVKYKTYSLERE